MDLLSECSQTVKETWPVVSEKWSVNLLETVFGAGIYTHVQLGHRNQAPGMGMRIKYYNNTKH